MSPLTKIFVGLLVVLSLVLAAAAVTFVNATNLDRAEARARIAQLDAEKAAATAAANDASVARGQLAAQYEQANNTAKTLADQVGQLQATVAQRDADVARVNSDKQLTDVDKNRLTAALAASETSKTQLIGQVDTYRGELDRLQRQFLETNAALTDRTNTLLVTEQQLRQSTEQLQEAQRRTEQLSAVLRDRGINAEDPTLQGGVAAGAPAINGEIRSRLQIAGMEYAVISVGSDDAVRRGMQFTVLDRQTGKFLGTLKVTEVEPNQAVGMLEGPEVARIARGAEVRTQLF